MFNQTKSCSKCKQFKEFVEFYTDSRRKDGLQSQCKTCFLDTKRQYQQSEEGKAYQKNYYEQYRQSDRGKDCIKKAQKRYTQSKKGKEFYRKAARRNYRKFPDRSKARNAISHAIAKGTLLPAKTYRCVYCDKQAKQYHHPDYAKPLGVIPVCTKCHILLNHSTD